VLIPENILTIPMHVTYPSFYEGFGNAFLEAVYFRKPVVVNTYAVYARDINPLEFKTVEMSQLITNQVVEQTRQALSDKVSAPNGRKPITSSA